MQRPRGKDSACGIRTSTRCKKSLLSASRRSSTGSAAKPACTSSFFLLARKHRTCSNPFGHQLVSIHVEILIMCKLDCIIRSLRVMAAGQHHELQGHVVNQYRVV